MTRLLSKLKENDEFYLYKNATFILFSYGINATFGFVFWIVLSNLVSKEAIGISSFLINGAVTISLYSRLGIDVAINRFLHENSLSKTELINNSVTASFLSSTLIGVLYTIITFSIVNKSSYANFNLSFLMLFIIFSILWSVQLIFDSIWIAYEQAKWITFKSLFFQCIKLLLAVVFVIFASFLHLELYFSIYFGWGISVLTTFIISFFVIRFIIVKHKIKFQLSKGIIKFTFKYSLDNYISTLLLGSFGSFIPIVIISKFGELYQGYFYIVWIIVNTGRYVPNSIFQALLPNISKESTGNELLHVKRKVLRALIVGFSMSTIITLLFYFLAPLILTFFNVSGDTTLVIKLFRLQAISIPFYCFNFFYITIKRFTKQTKEIIVFSAFTVVIQLIGIIIGFENFLVVSGSSFLISQILSSFLAFILLAKLYHIKDNLN